MYLRKKSWAAFKPLVLLLLLTGLPFTAFANITNSGNDAVQIKISRKTGFSQSYTLYPGQSLTIPEGSTKVLVEPRGFGTRGDEDIKVVIVTVTGEEATLDGFGQSFDLEKSPDAAVEEEALTLQYGKILNNGNNVVDIDIKDDKGLVNRRVVYPGQPLALAPNTVQVEIVPNSRLRGDEVVKVEVLMPDGEDHTITRLGGIARIKPDA